MMSMACQWPLAICMEDQDEAVQLHGSGWHFPLHQAAAYTGGSVLSTSSGPEDVVQLKVGKSVNGVKQGELLGHAKEFMKVFKLSAQ